MYMYMSTHMYVYMYMHNTLPSSIHNTVQTMILKKLLIYMYPLILLDQKPRLQFQSGYYPRAVFLYYSLVPRPLLQYYYACKVATSD